MSRKSVSCTWQKKANLFFFSSVLVYDSILKHRLIQKNDHYYVQLASDTNMLLYVLLWRLFKKILYLR